MQYGLYSGHAPANLALQREGTGKIQGIRSDAV